MYTQYNRKHMFLTHLGRVINTMNLLPTVTVMDTTGNVLFSCPGEENFLLFLKYKGPIKEKSGWSNQR